MCVCVCAHVFLCVCACVFIGRAKKVCQYTVSFFLFSFNLSLFFLFLLSIYLSSIHFINDRSLFVLSSHFPTTSHITPSYFPSYDSREGAIMTSDDRLVLVPIGKRVPMEAQPYSGKSPKGWRAPEGTTLFVGNLAFSVDNMR